MLKTTLKYIMGILVFLCISGFLLYVIGVAIMPQQIFALSRILNGNLEIKSIEIGNIKIDLKEHCLAFQKALMNGERAYDKNLKIPYRYIVGEIAATNNVKFFIGFLISKEKCDFVGVNFKDLDDESYVIQMPSEILDKIYQN